jgi:hypothetical protein
MVPKSFQEEDTAEPLDLRATARSALRFERGFLRRRWAAYYALWGVTVLSYYLFPYLFDLTPFAQLPFGVQFAVDASLDVVLTFAALTASIRIWGLSERTFDLRIATEGRRPMTRPANLLRYLLVAVVLGGAIVLSTRSASAAYLIGDTVLAVLSIFLLRHLGRAFRPVPTEGWVAAGAYLIAAVSSYVSLILLRYPVGHLLAWGTAAVIWLGCAVYARFRTHDEPPEGS